MIGPRRVDTLGEELDTLRATRAGAEVVEDDRHQLVDLVRPFRERQNFFDRMEARLRAPVSDPESG
jgi:hypothetical protein